MFKFLIFAVAGAACALGQTTTLVQGGAIGAVSISTALAGPMQNVTGAPYSAQSTTERFQMLADGNRILQNTSGFIARDSQGRTRRQENVPSSSNGTVEAPHFVMIDDPVAQVHLTLDEQNKIAIKMPVPNIKSGAMGIVAGSGLTTTSTFFASNSITATVPSRAIVRTDSPSPDPNFTKTDLGTQSFEGVPAQGTRTIRTIPAGRFGNELPMVITTETWFSPDLKVIVMSKTSDPRMGDTTYTLTSIQRAEPAASLFQVPDDYTIKEAPVPNIQLQAPKNPSGGANF